nr:HAD hydrolase-like protein [Gordonia shandongensis]
MTRSPLDFIADPGTALLVDLDGTVTDSYDGITRSFNHALDAIGEPRADDDFLRTIVGPPLADSLHARGLGDDRVAAAIAAYRERYDVVGWRENRVYDQMTELLRDLAASGRTMAIATSKNQRIARTIVDHFGLTPYFRFVAGAGENGTRPTKADVVGHALEVLQLDPTATPVVMIGDRSHDVVGAAEHGIPTVSVTWGYALPGELAAAASSVGLTGGAGIAPDRWIVDSVQRLREELGV